MNMDPKQYRKFAAAHAPKSPVVKNCVFAFLIGGCICAIGQGLLLLYQGPCGLEADTAKALVSISLIALAITLTAIGIFDKIAKVAGAGTLVPITGFANAMASPAIDSRAEGFVLGVGAKIFTVAGPVLLYGTLAGALYGVIYFIITRFTAG
ncbi:MAG: SpoVA/SpoVAEb family sporulation membrane protein [Clostridia bacterium]|nr:SpoVA/SpoVAEb family sporulation membrane protein [Clostridia bacterium]